MSAIKIHLTPPNAFDATPPSFRVLTLSTLEAVATVSLAADGYKLNARPNGTVWARDNAGREVWTGTLAELVEALLTARGAAS